MGQYGSLLKQSTIKTKSVQRTTKECLYYEKELKNAQAKYTEAIETNSDKSTIKKYKDLLEEAQNVLENAKGNRNTYTDQLRNFVDENKDFEEIVGTDELKKAKEILAHHEPKNEEKKDNSNLLKQLTIKTKSVQRTTKECLYYEKELKNAQAKYTEAIETNSDKSTIKKYKDLLEEAQNVLENAKGNRNTYTEQLRNFVDENKDFKEIVGTDEFKKAKEILAHQEPKNEEKKDNSNLLKQLT